jgi:AcrR family transcriptional regulator
VNYRKAANEAVRRSITGALVGLLGEKPLDQVGVTEVAAAAGVSRVSFYRNFDSMDDVVLAHMSRVADDVWEGHPAAGAQEEFRNLLRTFVALRPIAQGLHEANRDALVYRLVREAMGDGGPSERGAYGEAAVAGAVFGIYAQWVADGCAATADELYAESVAAFAALRADPAL